MPSVETIVAVMLAGLALSASPGPSMLYVLSRSVGQSRAAGLASAIGLGLGGLVLAVIAALGLAAVFQQSQAAIYGLTFVGAGYLIYLGVQMILETRDQEETDFSLQAVRERSFASIVWQGVLVEVLNPKTIFFFVLFIPSFLDANAGDVVMQTLILGVLVPLTAVPSDIAVAMIGGTAASAVRDNQKLRMALGWLGGLVLIGIGLSLFL